MDILDLSNDVINDIDTPLTDNDLPATVSHHFQSCHRRLMAFHVEDCGFFSLRSLRDIGTPDVADEDFGNIETMW
jgi:hypothetical protein